MYNVNSVNFLLSTINYCNSLLLQIRMQAEYQSGSNVARKGMIRSFMSMFKEEGFRGLYRVIIYNCNAISKSLILFSVKPIKLPVLRKSSST